MRTVSGAIETPSTTSIGPPKSLELAAVWSEENTGWAAVYNVVVAAEPNVTPAN
jgi:hypothetical protein